MGPRTSIERPAGKAILTCGQGSGGRCVALSRLRGGTNIG
jgi:hypothetical protein